MTQLILLVFYSPNSSGSSTPTNSINDGNLDVHESDPLGETRSIQSQLLSAGKDDEYDSAQGNDVASPLQHQRVRNPSSVVQRISSLMAIRNNVKTRRLYMYHLAFRWISFFSHKFMNCRTIYRATKTPNSISFGCQTINRRNAMNASRNSQHFDESITVACAVRYSVQNAAIKLCLGKLSNVPVSQMNW